MAEELKLGLQFAGRAFGPHYVIHAYTFNSKTYVKSVVLSIYKRVHYTFKVKVCHVNCFSQEFTFR